MYITTPSLKAVALDAATGREIWSFDPAEVQQARRRDPAAQSRRHVLEGRRRASGSFTSSETGSMRWTRKRAALISSFGKSGYIDLRENLGVDPATVGLEMTSPGAIYRNLLILGSRVNESYDASPGHIRAYDAVTGRLEVDVSHDSARRPTGPRDVEVGRRARTYGGANAWGGITVDEQRGWVFAATGSATDDFYGGFRKGIEPVRQQRPCARCCHWRAEVALPDRPPRYLGLRQSCRADSGHDHDRHNVEGRRRSAHEDGIHVRAGSRHRPAVVSCAGSRRYPDRLCLARRRGRRSRFRSSRRHWCASR